MVVSELISLLENGELKQLSVSADEYAIIGYINSGIIELHKRFDLLIKTEVVVTHPNALIYQLRNQDIMLIQSMYNKNGEELITQQYSREYDVKLITYNSFLLKAPMEGELYVVYRAMPPLVQTTVDTLPIPAAYIESLMHYVGYRAHGSMDGNIQAESSSHYTRFEKSCNTLQMLGYDSLHNLNGMDVSRKGFL